jgi:RNA ligase (TIGR02306 family)
MSSFHVPYTHIGNISIHPNADRLEIAQVGETDWQVVVGKGHQAPGDPCLYIPIDSILPEPLEAFLFPPDSKITLSKSRVRSIKIRGALSQGMVILPSVELMVLYPNVRWSKLSDGDDLAEALGITKYEPPAVHVQSAYGRVSGTTHNNPLFRKYTDIENFKYYPTLFEDGELVYVSEKLHGTSARYAMLPTHVYGFWKRVRKIFGFLPAYEFCYGSRNVQLQARKKLYYKSDVYDRVAKTYNLAAVLRPGEVLYGEIVGPGIQKGYTYGVTEGEVAFYAYDVSVDEKFLGFKRFVEWCDEHEIPRVPALYIGLFNKERIGTLLAGPSLLPNQPVKEGVVIKSLVERRSHIGRAVLKWVSDAYLLKPENTDIH